MAVSKNVVFLQSLFASKNAVDKKAENIEIVETREIACVKASYIKGIRGGTDEFKVKNKQFLQ
ncbi:MAG: hypothetical protein IJL38_07175 [Bacteroidales bacterium]|nr:hypothetical protein [Bacteroidales bacterium]